MTLETARESFAEMPASLQRHMKLGFETFMGLSANKRAELLSVVMGNFKQGARRLDPDEVAQTLGLTVKPEEASALIVSLSLIIAGVINGDERLEDLATVLVEKGLLAEERAPEFARSVQVIEASKDEVEDALQEARLTAEVLPSLRIFELVLDMRLRFQKEKVLNALPVVILHLETDGDGQEVWVQLTKSDVGEIIEKLKEVESQIALAEKWASGKS